MSRRARRTLFAALAMGLLTASCTETVATRERPALAELRAPLRRIAVLPFSATLQREEEGDEDAVVDARAAAQLVSRYVAEALAARGVEVVAPEDVAATLATADPSRRAGQVLQEKHATDAVVIGAVTRWEERQGESLGAIRAAAIGFRVTLQGADGRTLWSAEFDERQQPLSDNVLRAGQYPGGGSRWLTAEELARWGAQETVQKLPLGPEK